MRLRGLLDENSPFARFVSKVVDLCGLDLLWLVLCLPVVTAGASTCALHSAIVRLRRDDPGVFRCFFRAFKRDFLQATTLWLLLVVAVVGIAASYWVTSGLEGAASVVARVVLCVPTVLLILIAVYGFPLLARFQVSLGALLTDTVLLGLANFPRTLLLVVINLLPILAAYYLSSIFMAMVFIWLPLGFSLTALGTEKCLDPIMAKLEKTAGSDGY